MLKDFEEKYKFVLEKSFDIGEYGYAYLISVYIYSETFIIENSYHYYFCIFFPNDSNNELTAMKEAVWTDLNTIENEFLPGTLMYSVLKDYVKDCINKVSQGHGQDLFTDAEDAVFNVFIKLHQKKLLSKI